MKNNYIHNLQRDAYGINGALINPSIEQISKDETIFKLQQQVLEQKELISGIKITISDGILTYESIHHQVSNLINTYKEKYK